MIKSVFITKEKNNPAIVSVNYVTMYTDIIKNYTCKKIPDTVKHFVRTATFYNREITENKIIDVYFKD